MNLPQNPGINREEEIAIKLKTAFPQANAITTIHPRMKNDELLNHIAASNLFLLFNHYSLLGTKIHDYIALKRNILFCYSGDSEDQSMKNQFYKS